MVADTPDGDVAAVRDESVVVEQSSSPGKPDQLTSQLGPQFPVKVVHEQRPAHPLQWPFPIPPLPIPRDPSELQSPYSEPQPLAKRVPPEVAEKVASAGAAVIGLPLFAHAWAMFPKIAENVSVVMFGSESQSDVQF